MSRTIEYTERLETTRCWCGINFAIPENLWLAAHNDAQQIYCPLGHTMVWRETEAQRLAKQLEESRTRLGETERRVRAERDLREHTERQLSAQKAATTRAKKRHAAGVCPCCNRTFQQLARHMQTKHPDFDPAKEA